jgi:GNAT superfamily N-acetyltransferase/8-oxo-dGTP pyrophosphatase MutT (NUDIX family)
MTKIQADFAEHAGDEIWVHYSNVPQVTINPKGFHQDPAGVYLFPKDFQPNPNWLLMKYRFEVKLDTSTRVLDLSTLSIPEAKKILDQMGLGERAEADKYFMDETRSHQDRIDTFWEIMKNEFILRDGKRPGAWNKALRKLGYDAVFDDIKVIHTAEEQLLVLDKSKIQVLKQEDQGDTGFEDAKTVIAQLKKLVAPYGKVEVTPPRKATVHFNHVGIEGGVKVYDGTKPYTGHYANWKVYPRKTDKKDARPVYISVALSSASHRFDWSVGTTIDRFGRDGKPGMDLSELEKNIKSAMDKIWESAPAVESATIDGARDEAAVKKDPEKALAASPELLTFYYMADRDANEDQWREEALEEFNNSDDESIDEQIEWWFQEGNWDHDEYLEELKQLSPERRRAKRLEHFQDQYVKGREENEDSSLVYFEDPKVLGKTTLYRFTPAKPEEILSKGFQGKAPERLGLTHHEYSAMGDLAFAFEKKDMKSKKEIRSMMLKYGPNVFQFTVPYAVKAHHNTDWEDQVVFDVTTAQNLKLLWSGPQDMKIASWVEAAAKDEAGITDTDFPYFHVSDHPETPRHNDKPKKPHFDPNGIFLFVKGEKVGVAEWQRKKYRWDAKLAPGTKLLDLDSMGPTSAWELIRRAGIKTPQDCYDVLEYDWEPEAEQMESDCGTPDAPDFEKKFWSNYFTIDHAATAAYTIIRAHFKDRYKFTQFFRELGYDGIYDTHGAIYYEEPQVVMMNPDKIIWGKREKNTPDPKIYRIETNASGYSEAAKPKNKSKQKKFKLFLDAATQVLNEAGLHDPKISDSACTNICGMLITTIDRLDLDADLYICTVKGTPHHVLVNEGVLIDFTLAQFYPDAEWPVIEPLKSEFVKNTYKDLKVESMDRFDSIATVGQFRYGSLGKKIYKIVDKATEASVEASTVVTADAAALLEKFDKVLDYRILRPHFNSNKKFTEFLREQGFDAVYDTVGAAYEREPQVIVLNPEKIEWLDREKNKPDKGQKIYRLKSDLAESAIPAEDGFEIIPHFDETFYHGSPKPVGKFEISKGGGRFGQGVYLTTRETAEFYAKGGRQGNAGQRLKESPGHLYAVQVAGRAVKITDEQAFYRMLIHEDETAEQAYQNSGDIESGKITRQAGPWAAGNGYDLLLFDPKETSVLTPFTQVLVVNQKALKKTREVRKAKVASSMPTLKGYRFEHAWEGKELQIRVYDGDKKIGMFEGAESHSQPGKLYPLGIKVDPAYQRQGIATAIYQWAEELSGMKIIPGNSHSPEGLRFRKAWDKRTTSAKSIGPIWYHLTDNEKFKLDPDYAPEDNAFALDDRSGRRGIYLAEEIEPWLNGKGYWRPFVVEFQVDPSVVNDPGVNGRWGGEMFVPSTSFDKLKVLRVIPLDAYCREEFKEYGWIEGDLGREFDTGKEIPEKYSERKKLPGYKYTGPDVRDMPAAEIAKLKKDLKTVKFPEQAGAAVQAAKTFQDEGIVDGNWGSQASGILFHVDDHVLLLKRSADVMDPNLWGIPGGAVPIDADGKPMDPKASAIEEADEEIGGVPPHRDTGKHVVFKKGKFRYTTYLFEVVEEFGPILNWEHTDAKWFPIDDLPTDIHPGALWAIEKIFFGETSAAKIAAIGALPLKNPSGWISPIGKWHPTNEAHYYNIALLAFPEEFNPDVEGDDMEVLRDYANRAYNDGWISVGHAGDVNVAGKASILENTKSLQVKTLRTVFKDSPEETIRVELLGKKFAVYDLNRFLKTGTWTKPRVEAALSWKDVVRGEWWITPDGSSEFADQDVGEAGHEAIAVRHYLNKYEDELKEELDPDADLDALTEMYFGNGISDEVGERVMGPIWQELKADARLTYAKHEGMILAINTSFAAYTVTNQTIKAIQDFLGERLSEFGDDVTGDTEMTVEEFSTGKSHSISISDFLGLKYAAQLWKAISVLAASNKIPDLLYHGSPTQGLTDLFYDPAFTRRDAGTLVEGEGVYLTESYRVARGYAGSEGSIYEVKLKADGVFLADKKQSYLDIYKSVQKKFKINLARMETKWCIERSMDGTGSVTGFGDSIRQVLVNDESFVTNPDNENKAEEIQEFINQEIAGWPVVRYLDPNIDDGRTHVYVVRQDSPGQHIQIVREIVVMSDEDEAEVNNLPTESAISSKKEPVKSIKTQHNGYRLSNTLADENGLFEVGAFQGKEEIGSAVFRIVGDNIRPVSNAEAREFGLSSGTAVNPEHQRQGIATALYVHAEKASGKKVIPSTDQTDDARKFWAQPNRPFGVTSSAAATLEPLVYIVRSR